MGFLKVPIKKCDFVGMWRRPDFCKSEIINILACMDTLGQGGKPVALGAMMSEGLAKSHSSLEGDKHCFCVPRTCEYDGSSFSIRCCEQQVTGAVQKIQGSSYVCACEVPLLDRGG